MSDMLALAERVWRGEVQYHPFRGAGTQCEVADGVAFVHGFANVAAFVTDDGLVLVDTSSPFLADVMHEAVRRWSRRARCTPRSSRTATSTTSSASTATRPTTRCTARAPPRCVAHEAVPARFDRYVETAGYNGIINQRQFHSRDATGRSTTATPTRRTATGSTSTSAVAGSSSTTTAARPTTTRGSGSPTDRVLCTGDLFIWASPNCGNPQKVQRYPKDWAAALRTMAALDAEVLLPGHGLPIVGADRVRQALAETARAPRGPPRRDARDDERGRAPRRDRAHGARPGAPARAPVPPPVYDEPEFVVRNVWRLYGGWYDGNPAHLKPPRERGRRRRGRGARRRAGGTGSARRTRSPTAVTSGSRPTSRSGPQLPLPTTRRRSRRCAPSTRGASRRRRRRWRRASSAGPQPAAIRRAHHEARRVHRAGDRCVVRHRRRAGADAGGEGRNRRHRGAPPGAPRGGPRAMPSGTRLRLACGPSTWATSMRPSESPATRGTPSAASTAS